MKGRAKIVVAITTATMAAVAGYWGLSRRVEIFSIPCRYEGPFFVSFNDPTGVPPAKLDFWRVEYAVNGEGIARINGIPPAGRWVYFEIHERCEPDRPTDREWNYSVGTRYGQGREHFDYACFYEPSISTQEVCEGFVASTVDRRLRSAAGNHK